MVLNKAQRYYFNTRTCMRWDRSSIWWIEQGLLQLCNKTCQLSQGCKKECIKRNKCLVSIWDECGICYPFIDYDKWSYSYSLMLTKLHSDLSLNYIQILLNRPFPSHTCMSTCSIICFVLHRLPSPMGLNTVWFDFGKKLFCCFSISYQIKCSFIQMYNQNTYSNVWHVPSVYRYA